MYINISRKYQLKVNYLTGKTSGVRSPICMSFPLTVPCVLGLVSSNFRATGLPASECVTVSLSCDFPERDSCCNLGMCIGGRGEYCDNRGPLWGRVGSWAVLGGEWLSVPERGNKKIVNLSFCELYFACSHYLRAWDRIRTVIQQCRSFLELLISMVPKLSQLYCYQG